MQENQTKNEQQVAFAGVSRKAPTVARTANIYEEFVLWGAMPAPEQKRLGIETMEQFAAFHKVGNRTLSRWRALPDYQARVRELRQHWGFGKTSNVINAIYNTALKGNAISQQLWLAYFEGFDPKNKKEEVKTAMELTTRDIAFMIEQLPEQLQQKHYDNLALLLDDVDAIKNARDIEVPAEAEDGGEERSEENISGDPYQDAQEVSYKEADAVAQSDQSGVRPDLERSAPTHHNQSATRWREKQTLRDGWF